MLYGLSHTKDCQRPGRSGEYRAVALVNARIKQRSIDLIFVDRDLGWFRVCWITSWNNILTDRRTKFVFCRLQRPINGRFCELDEVRSKEWENVHRFGIPKSTIIFDDHNSRFRYHKLSIKNSFILHSAAFQRVNRILHDGNGSAIVRLLHKRQNVRLVCIRTHATGVWSKIPFKSPLMILNSRCGSYHVSIHECLQGELFSRKTLFNDDRSIELFKIISTLRIAADDHDTLTAS